MRVQSLVLIAVVGCSSSNPSTDTDGGLTDGGPSCSSTCAVSTPTCGVYEACGQAINCGMCAFDSSSLPYASDGTGAAAIAPSGAIEIAYLAQADSSVHVAHFTAGTWSDEVALPRPPNGTATILDLAVAPDGTRWLAYTVTGVFDAYVTSAPEGGSWTPSVEIGGAGPLAVGSDGTPWVAYTGNAGLYVTSPVGATWTPTLVSPSEPYGPIYIAASGTQPVVVFDGGGAQLAQLGTTGWTVAPIPGLASFDQGGLGLAADGAGHVAVIASHDDALAAYVLSGTTWTTTPLPLSQDLLPDEVSGGSISATYDAHGTLWLVAGSTASYLINVTPEAIPIQRIFQTPGTISVLPDPVNGVAIIHGGDVLTRAGAVSTSSASACTEIATSLCHSACDTCITQGRCSWTWSKTGSGGNTYGSEADCVYALTSTMCGDADDADGSELTACVDALPSATCTGPTADCTAGCVALPAACAMLY